MPSPLCNKDLKTKVQAMMKAVENYLGEEEGLRFIRKITCATIENDNLTMKRHSGSEGILK